jgi:hypothetical protein
MGDDCRGLEMTGRTGMIGVDIFFSVKKIDEKSYKQEEKEKNEMGNLFLFINGSLPCS